MKSSIYLTAVIVSTLLNMNLAYSQDEKESAVEQSTQNTVANEWITATFDPEKSGRLEMFKSKKDFLLWPHKKIDLASDTFPGNSLLLYAEHPLSSSQMLPLPETLSIEKRIPQNSTPSIIHMKGENESLAIAKEISLKGTEAILWITTTIQNKGKQIVTFFPTEITSINAEFGISNMANMNRLFYSPYTPISEENDGIDVTLGLVNNPEFQPLSDKEIFFMKYLGRIGEVRLTNKKQWFAIQDEKSARVYGIEYDFYDIKPKPIANNVILFSNGAGEFFHEGQLHYNNTDVEKYIRLTYVMGQVDLNPGDSFSYEKKWSVTSNIAPIIDIENGISYSKHIDVLHDEVGFYIFGAVGIPQNGPVGFQFLDEHGEILRKNYSISLLLNPFHKIKRPANSVIEYPTVVSHQIGFPVVDSGEIDKTVFQVLMEKTQKIQMVLLDKKAEKPIRVIDEYTGAIPEYKEAEYHW